MSSSNGEKQICEIAQVSFDEFDAPSYDAWKEEAVVSLKGGDFEKRLFTKTYEGIRLEPIYTMEHARHLTHTGALPGFAPYVRGTAASGYIARPWLIAQECDEALPEQCGQLLRHELEKGATCLHVVLDPATRQGKDADKAEAEAVGKGLSLSTIADACQVFDGIDLQKHPLHLAAGASSMMIQAMLCAMLQAKGETFDKMSGCVGADPVGVMAQAGALPCSLDSLYDEMAHITAWVDKHMPGMRNILIQGQPYHDGGAGAIQELGYSMATAVEYIRAMQLRGIDINVAAKHIRFSFSLGANFFMEIAKLRAARMVWAQVVAAFGGGEAAQKMDIHARTSAFTKTVYDPYVNMLRTTTEAFSAVVGGADSLHAGCFDEAIRSGDEFSRRIARNTQIILQNECNLQQPVDPAGGSWYIENLTSQIADQSWALLQQIDAVGGIVKALQQEIPQKAIEAVLDKRLKQLAMRADRAVGINMYPNIQEKRLDAHPVDNSIREERCRQIAAYRADIDRTYCKEKLQQIPDTLSQEHGKLMDAVIAAFKSGATIEEVAAALRQDEAAEPAIRPIAAHRLAEQFEKLRQTTEIYQEKTGRSLKVFLANMGKIPQHKPRADFSTGFMEVGGFEVLKNDGFPTVEAAAEAAVSSGAAVTVICSTDDTYPELVPPLAAKIKAAKPDMIVILAGAPAPEYESVYRESGVDEFIHVRANCYKILSWLQIAGGIA